MASDVFKNGIETRDLGRAGDLDSSSLPDMAVQNLAYLSRLLELTSKIELTEIEEAEKKIIVEIQENLLNGKAPAVLIAGKFEKGEGKTIEAFDPSTGFQVFNGSEASADQVDECLDFAVEAFEGWNNLEWNERAVYLNNLAEIFAKRKNELAVALSMDTGRLLPETLLEVDSLISKIKAAVNHPYKDPKFVSEGEYIQYKPLGVIAVIGPYNIPLGLVNGPAVHALAMGNSVVIKFSEVTPLAGHIYAQCLHEAGFPEGVVSVVQGGKNVGQALVQSNKINGLFFTGSSEVGIAINKQLASRPDVLASLEMSGVNPMILDLSDSESYAKFADLVLQSSFYTSGQRCVNGRHLYCVGSEIELENFKSVLLEKLSSKKVGAWNSAERVDYGPLVSIEAAEKVVKKVGTVADVAVQTNARVWSQLEHINGGTTNAFVKPGIIQVAKDYPAGEEIFGPFLLVTLADTVEEAVVLANRSPKVISAGIYTNKQEFADFAIDKVKAGVIRVNEPTTGANGLMPFGGIGMAGNHRPVGSFTMDQVCYPQAVTNKKSLL